MYVCGFPCQPFSIAGKRGGVNDPRGAVFWACLDVIKTKQPAYFILENVKGLINIDNGKTFETIVRELEKVCNKYKYAAWIHVLNTKDYGIPQNRERVYIIGIKNSVGKTFTLPAPVKMKSISKFVDLSDTHTEEPYPSTTHIVENARGTYVNLSFQYIGAVDYAPCLDTNGSMWNVKMHRFATVREYLMLQGFPLNFKQVVSDRQLKKQIGNSMSVNVLAHLFKYMLS
jgi:DNA (cytosine-5)-methyltransferase 1